MNKGDFSGVSDFLLEMKEDVSVPKNVKTKINTIMCMINEDCDKSIKASKISHELGELSEDSNLNQFTRTQIWNVISMLEKI